MEEKNKNRAKNLFCDMGLMLKTRPQSVMQDALRVFFRQALRRAITANGKEAA